MVCGERSGRGCGVQSSEGQEREVIAVRVKGRVKWVGCWVKGRV